MQVSPQKSGVVYPGEDEVSVELDPGDIACLMNEDSTSCTATIGRNAVYQVTITQTNRVGATTNNSLSFDRMFYALQCDVHWGSGYIGRVGPIKDSLTYRPSSQGWASRVLPLIYVYLYMLDTGFCGWFYFLSFFYIS